MEKKTRNIVIIIVAILSIVALGGAVYFVSSWAIDNSSFSLEGIWTDKTTYYEFHSNGTFYEWARGDGDKVWFGNYTISAGHPFKLTIEYYTDLIYMVDPDTRVYNLDFITTVGGAVTRSIELDGWEYEYYGPVDSYNFSSI
jgi:hypothetical protein